MCLFHISSFHVTSLWMMVTVWKVKNFGLWKASLCCFWVILVVWFEPAGTVSWFSLTTTLACWILRSSCDIVFGLETLFISSCISMLHCLWSSLLRDFIQCGLVVSHLCFGTYRLVQSSRGGRQSWISWSLQMTPSITCTFPICCFRSS